ncbi:hypothetical protein B0H17DRAFT_681741 [Mycena rosella]|uniref:Uncharacterized protein n=1 Tax=Mycena rosella TaxID=1033263 RepID=A0AAD7FBY4_MYCRO|nr:hypothetical protein B0H17DRAFT_681741 [Mycena rosella]
MLDNRLNRRHPDPKLSESMCDPYLESTWLMNCLRPVGMSHSFRQSQGQCTLWIRPSTGNLCLDLTPDDFDFLMYYDPDFAESRHVSTRDHLLEPDQHCDIVSDISSSISAHTSLKPGAVYRNLGADCDSPVEVAFASDVECTGGVWIKPDNTVPGQIMEDAWWISEDCWLSQANHIFKCLNITSNYEDYVVLNDLWYQLTFSEPTDGLPPGYLFLCPREDFTG